MSDETLQPAGAEPAPAPVPPAAPAADAPPPVAWTPDQVQGLLRNVYDPELHFNIVDLGLIYGVQVADGAVSVQMTLTSPGCPYGPYLVQNVRDTLRALRGVRDISVEVVWEPPWGPEKMSEEIRLELGFDV